MRRDVKGLHGVKGNCFHSDTLGFHIEKPEHWSFLPVNWVPTLKSRVDFRTLQAQIAGQGTAPFVYMHYLHKSSRYVYPTVQVGCRLLVGELPEADRFLAFAVQTLKAAHADVKILETSDSAILGGISGFFIRSNFTITRTDGARFGCLARSYTLITNGFVFNIGMSGPGKGPYVCEDDFQFIARSVLITAPRCRPRSR